jgi:hypothetical protein
MIRIASDINGCVPECRYHRPFGRIEDEEIVSWYEEIHLLKLLNQ